MNHAACGSCRAHITWMTTKNGKSMPVDGLRSETQWEPAFGSHWDTCPYADQHKKKPAPVVARPLNLAFGEPPAEKVALWAERAKRFATPEGVTEKMGRIAAEAKRLQAQGVSRAVIAGISEEVTGLPQFKHLHCCSQQTLQALIDRLTEEATC